MENCANCGLECPGDCMNCPNCGTSCDCDANNNVMCCNHVIPEGPCGPKGNSGLMGPIGPAGMDGESCSLVMSVNVELCSPVMKLLVSNGDCVVLNTCPLKPISTSASSVTEPWLSGNLVNPTFDDESPSWWMSLVNTGNPEWVVYDFGKKVLITCVHLSCNNGRIGSSPKLQGSNDGTVWVDLTDLPNSEWNYPEPNPHNLVKLSKCINSNDVAYRCVRLCSEPTVYCCYDHIQFYGLM